MILALVCSFITGALTLVLSHIAHTKIAQKAIDKHDELVKPITDEAFLDGFEKGWEAAINEPITVKAAYERIFKTQ